MKKLTYLLLVLVTICFSGCNERNKYINCTLEEKENQSCNFNLNPVCWDNWETYWNACVACASNDINSYKIWECPICDDSKWTCAIWNVWENDVNIDVDAPNREVYIEIPAPNFE
jgi:hypothetical protein